MNGGNKGNNDGNDAKERKAVRSIVSCSLEKEVDEPWPRHLLSLGNFMIDG